VSLWLAPTSRCSGSAVRDPHVQNISIRHPRLQCNSSECQVMCLTSGPASHRPAPYGPRCISPHGTHTTLPMPWSSPPRGGAARSLCLCDAHASTRRQPSHARATATVDTQATQTSVPQRTWHERSLVWQQQCAQLQVALPCAGLGTLAATQRTRLVTAGTPVWTLGLAGCGAVDETLEAQASLPACDTWRQTQEAA
jgi:hypothetical protein